MDLKGLPTHLRTNTMFIFVHSNLHSAAFQLAAQIVMKVLLSFTVVSSFIPAAQEDDTLKNIRLKSVLFFVWIISMDRRRRGRS